MNQEIHDLLAVLQDTRRRLHALIEQTSQYQDDQWGNLVGARVDLRHADREIDSAASYIRRLIVNGKKPWDEEVTV